MKERFAPVWKELADLIADPKVIVNGQTYTLDIVCGSDYKVFCIQHIHDTLHVTAV